MHSLLRTRRSSLLLAALLSLTLLASSVLSAHVHKDGLSHYSDCDICLQLSGLDSVSQQPVLQTPLGIVSPSSSDYVFHSSSTAPRFFQPRAPPSFTKH